MRHTEVTSGLEEVYRSSQALMNEAMANHENAVDVLRSIRFVLRGTPGGELFVDGIEKVLIHQENLRRLAQSYHQAVGLVIKQDES